MATFANRWGPDNIPDALGVPQIGLSVTVRLPGTVNPATLYTDRTKSVGAANPVTTDAAGNLAIWTDSDFVDFFASGATFAANVRCVPDPADIAASPLVNVNNYPYLATGNGVTNDTTSLQNALNDARTAGVNTLVLVPPGDYLVSQQVHPVSGAYHACLIIGSNTTLFLMPGARIIQDDSQAFGTQASAIVMNYNVTAGDVGIKFFGGLYDGDGANQTLTQSGILLIKTAGSYLQNVEVRNCKGTAASGVNETFHFETQSGSATTYVDCRATRTAGTTASGFSANQHAHAHYIGCVAKGMTVANGFTHNACKDLTYSDCHSYDNAGVGFNSEVSTNVTYTACTAGGEALGTANYPFTSLESLGNTAAGFVINGTTNGQLIGCTSEKNSAGAIFQDAGADLASGRVVGGSYSNNGYGIIWQGTAATRVEVIGNPVATGNATAQYQIPASNISAPGNPGYQPAVAASTVAVANPFPWDCSVYIDGGTLTGGGVTVDGANLGNRETVRVPQGKSVSISYSAAPTWVWILD